MEQTENRALHGPDLSHLLLPSFQGSYKAVPPTATCFFQALTRLHQHLCSKVQESLARTPPPLPPSPKPPPCILPTAPAAGHNAPRHLKDSYPQHTLSLCHLLSPHPRLLPPQSRTASAMCWVADVGALSPADSSNGPTHLAAKITFVAE